MKPRETVFDGFNLYRILASYVNVRMGRSLFATLEGGSHAVDFGISRLVVLVAAHPSINQELQARLQFFLGCVVKVKLQAVQ